MALNIDDNLILPSIPSTAHLIVFLCCLASTIALEQLNNYNILESPNNVLTAFTNEPDF